MKQSKIIVVTSGKGGVGKTTTTANIGVSLAQKGFKVCVIDADIGLKNLDLVLGLENRIVYTIIDIVNGNKKVKDTLVKHKTIKNLNLLASSQVANKNMVEPEDMVNIVDELTKMFDYILIDSPAGIERGFSNSIKAAQHAIVVTTPDLTAISDADRVIGLLENEGFNDNNISLIVNRIKPKMVEKKEMLSPEDIKEALAINLIGIIPDSEDIIISTNEGKPIALDPTKSVSLNFNNIASRISGDDIPIEEDIKKNNIDTEGFFSFLKKMIGRR